MRNQKGFLQFLNRGAFAALVILFGLAGAFAAESQKLPFSGEWEGDSKVFRFKGGPLQEPLKVTFHVAGNPPVLGAISHQRGNLPEGRTKHFEVQGTKIKFWVGPPDESGRGKQVYDLELKDGVLSGTLVGPTPVGQQLKSEIVLRPK